jgi:hypothetical protein
MSRRKRAYGVSKPNRGVMGGRYLFTVRYAVLERRVSPGDYRCPDVPDAPDVPGDWADAGRVCTRV